MADQPQKPAPAPVSLNDRPSAADRVRQVQEMQRRMGVQESKAPAEIVRPTVVTAPRTPAVFDVSAPRGAGPSIAPERTPTNPSVYASAQVDASKLFGGNEGVELIGCPWKVIDFQSHAPVLFDAPKPLQNYETRLPKNAVKTEHGHLFQVSLEPKANGAEAPLRRAVLTNAQGALSGAECRNAGELQKLLSRSSAIANELLASAFGDSKGANIVNIASGKRAAFEVTVARGEEMKTVQVNNFARPIPAGMDPAAANVLVANYFLDKFDAA